MEITCQMSNQEGGSWPETASPNLKDSKPHLNSELVFSVIPLFQDPRITEYCANLKILQFITLIFQIEIQAVLERRGLIK